MSINHTKSIEVQKGATTTTTAEIEAIHKEVISVYRQICKTDHSLRRHTLYIDTKAELKKVYLRNIHLLSLIRDYLKRVVAVAQLLDSIDNGRREAERKHQTQKENKRQLKKSRRRGCFRPKVSKSLKQGGGFYEEFVDKLKSELVEQECLLYQFTLELPKFDIKYQAVEFWNRVKPILPVVSQVASITLSVISPVTAVIGVIGKFALNAVTDYGNSAFQYYVDKNIVEPASVVKAIIANINYTMDALEEIKGIMIQTSSKQNLSSNPYLDICLRQRAEKSINEEMLRFGKLLLEALRFEKLSSRLEKKMMKYKNRNRILLAAIVVKIAGKD